MHFIVLLWSESLHIAILVVLDVISLTWWLHDNIVVTRVFEYREFWLHGSIMLQWSLTGLETNQQFRSKLQPD